MMTVQTMHGLFLSSTQKLYLYIYKNAINYLGLTPFLQEIKKSPLTWKVDVLLMVANPHPLWSLAW
jgi:hypothetical protein